MQLGEGPPHLLEVHTRLHTRELASFLPSLSLPLWPRVKMRPSEERPRGQSSVSRLSGWLLGRVKGIQDSAPTSQVPVLGQAVPLSRLDSPYVMNTDLARPPVVTVSICRRGNWLREAQGHATEQMQRGPQVSV